MSSIPYSEFLDYLSENKKEFLTFTENTKSKFYSTLESYGIVKKDWEQLIDINQYEGGVAFYFDNKNATTNHGLFSQMIIPAIVARLNENGEENNLITLFKNIASITKNLPELKKNSSSYAEIKTHNAEVNASLSELIQEKDKLDIHIENGRSILKALSNEMSVLSKEKDDYESQLLELTKLQQDLNWKQNNLQYVIKHYELKDVMDTLLSNQEKLNNHEQLQNQMKKEKENYELHLQLKRWSEVEQQQKAILSKIDTIEQSQEFSQSKEALNLFENKIEDEWNAVSKEINRITTNSEEYKNYIHTLEDKLKEEIESLKLQLSEYEIEAGVTKEFIKNFKLEIETSKAIYGEYFYNDIGQILSQKKNELNNNKEKYSSLIQEQRDKQSEKEKLDRSDAALKQEIESKSDTLGKLKDKWEHQTEKERTIIQKVTKILHVTTVEVEDFRKWLKEQIPIIQRKVNEREIKLNQLNIKLFELLFELKQIHKPFLIPSEEVFKVKSLLDEKGVPVLYGDEYIKQQNLERREQLNKDHPLLKYGLVVPNQNKSYISEISKLDKEYFHVPIPIYWVNQLDQSSDLQFVLLDKSATELSINDDKLANRKKALSSESDELNSGISINKTYIKELTKLVAEMESFDVRETESELANQYEIFQSHLEEKINDKAVYEQQLKSINMDLANISTAIESLTNINNTLNSELILLENWIEKKKKYEDEKEKKHKLSLKIQSSKSKIGDKENDYKRVINDFNIWERSYLDWKYSIEKLVGEVKEVLPKIFVENIITQKTQGIQPYFSLDLNILRDYLYKWKNEQQNMQDRNTELAGLKGELRQIKNAVTTEEKKLSKLNTGWRELPLPEESLLILEQRLEQKEESLKQIDKGIIRLKAAIEHGEFYKQKLDDELKNFSVENFQKRPPVIWPLSDFSKMKSEIKQSITENKVEINETNDIIEDLKTNIGKFHGIYQKVEITLNIININSGLIPSTYIQNLVQKEPVKTGEEWIGKFKDLQINVDKKKRAVQALHRKKKEFFEKSEWTFEIKDVALKVYSDMDFDELHEVKASIEGLDLLATNEILEAEEEKNTAEIAKKEWVEHACKYALVLVDNLRKMINAMRITNRNGYNFPLVKLKRDNLLPTELDQIKGAIDDLFDKVIIELFTDFQDINEIPQKVFKEKINTKNIIFAAFNYQYPVLRLYRLHEENSFLYEPPKEEFYTDWETINESSKTDPSGSGGQLFSARTLILMMLTSFKRTNAENSNWKLLITDNPFSVAVSDHIVDPILAIAEELKFQWIVVTPPELVKIELLQKFDMYYHLSAKSISNGADQVVTEVQYGYRNYKKSNSILKEKEIVLYELN